MTIENIKLMCKNCLWHGLAKEALIVQRIEPCDCLNSYGGLTLHLMCPECLDAPAVPFDEEEYEELRKEEGTF